MSDSNIYFGGDRFNGILIQPKAEFSFCKTCAGLSENPEIFKDDENAIVRIFEYQTTKTLLGERMISDNKLEELADNYILNNMSDFPDNIDSYKSGYRQAEEEAAELSDNSHRALIMIEDAYSILLNNGSPKIAQEMEQISEAIDLLKQTLAKRQECCV